MAELEDKPLTLPPRSQLVKIKQNILDLPPILLAPGTWITGLIGLMLGYSSGVVLLFQAADNAHLPSAVLASWIWAIMLGCGVGSVILCLWYRQPLLVAFSTAGSAVLVSSLGRFSMEQAVGAYLVAALAVVLLGVLGLFRKMLLLVPPPIAMSMLAGVLLHFGIDLFATLPKEPGLVVGMVLTFFILRRLRSRMPVLGALVIGIVIAGISGQLQFKDLSFALTTPVWIWPQFDLNSILTISLPLFVLANASQNAPGIAVMQHAGYNTPIDGPIAFTGLGSLLTAPFGGHGLNLSAVMAILCTSPEAHPDPDKRYGVGVAVGVWYIVTGLFGATSAALFAGFPKALIAALAGLAMLSTILSALGAAMSDQAEREGALITLLVTASGLSLFGIGAPFWGLVFGVLASKFLRPVLPVPKSEAFQGEK